MSDDAGPARPSAFHLAVRFILEMCVFASFGIWGWSLSEQLWLRLLLAIAFPLVAILAWSLAGATGDPVRGGPLLPVPGRIRLLVEAAIVGLGTYGLWTGWSRAAAETMLTALFLNYAFTWERIWWLIRADSRGMVEL